MSREQRKLRTDIVFKGCGGLNDAFDDAIKSAWYINDEEYDYICEKATDEELDLFLGGDGKFSNMKKALATVGKLIDEMYNSL
tara:strand:- start:395 stop:643 length:249 start_codon:yes stop_codon:yes gene_type:complete